MQPREALKAWGRSAHAPAGAYAALSLVNAAGASGFAFGLAAFLAQPSAGPLALALGGLAVRGAANWASSGLAARHARRVISMVRRRAVAGVLDHRRGEAPALGESLSTVVDEVEALDGYYSRYRPAELDARLGPLAIAAFAALASPVAAAIMLATLAPLVAVLALAGGAAAATARRQFEALSRLSGHFVDRVRALPLILAFEAEEREAERVAAAARDVTHRTLGVLRIAFVSSAALEFFAALSVALVAVYCGFSLLGLLPFPAPETLEFRSTFAALALAPEFYAPLRRLAAAYHERQLGEAAAARLAPGLRTVEPTLPAPPEWGRPPEIRLRDVTMRLGDRTVGPVDGVVRAGALTALVGETGSGKSSLLAAIVGIAPIAGGAVVSDAPAPAQRPDPSRWVAWAGQTPMFLPGTILENLLAASPGATREDACAMLEAVGLGPALAARPLGLQTALDERGSGLSGGERRRLALARALLRPASLLVLDEPTAELDPQSEAEIIALVRSATGQRTVLVATHSERMAAAADHILRLT